MEELTELRSRITIFDLIFNNWITTSIASLGVLADYFLGRIPYPNERNSSRLFRFIDDNFDEKVDLKEFQSYLVKLFHAHGMARLSLVSIGCPMSDDNLEMPLKAN